MTEQVATTQTQWVHANIAPLLGDGHGHYRVHIIGNSGSGKTTTGAELAKILGIPFIAMDTLFFDPGWVESSKEVFQARLRAALDAEKRGWVADGNFIEMGGGLVFEEATDIIWLDPPLYAYFPRLLWRTFLRLLRLTPPCAPGCFEDPRETFFSSKSIIWWCITRHAITRQRNVERMQVYGIEDGTDISRRRMRRFGGWGGDVATWLEQVRDMLRFKGE